MNFHIIYYLVYMLIMQVHHDSGCMPIPIRRYDSGHISWFWLHFLITVDVMTPITHHSSDRWACCMSYNLSCERLRMTVLDDCSILQPRHLVRSRLGETYDSINVQKLSISRLRIFKLSGHVSYDQWQIHWYWFFKLCLTICIIYF
jgi:hypothetical protein